MMSDTNAVIAAALADPPPTDPFGDAGLTYADVVAAAVTALETVVNLLSDDDAATVIAAFESRAALYAGTDP